MNGYQCYLKRMDQVLPMEIFASQNLNYNLGLKLVRGAYMNEERSLAHDEGRESPVWDTIEDTHRCYNTNMERALTQMKPTDMVFIASHNQDTCTLVKSILEKNSPEKHKRVKFGQLLGFSDQITNQLAIEGYSSYKYVPFGPSEQVMPYLIRRGQESR